MGKKSRLKAERASAGVQLPSEVQPASWVGLLVVFLGVGLILSSLFQMSMLPGYAQYRQYFHGHSEGFVQFRYMISWLIRWLGVALGIGLLCRKELFRKATVFLSWGMIALAYWKHPYDAMLQHVRFVNERFAASGSAFSPQSVIQYAQTWNMSWFSESFFVWLCVAFGIATDLCAALFVIYMLTRSSVKPYFR